ncbi:hypothetical protein GIB67_016945 [Kingdonia uniflora]|uniref:Pentatricopeptide repeat-containing protein n=1 Tax=Kingdonia uniflora TaxID=39325 RepID=A0A7J7M3H3_9MAGN|nr:hypothetical protein GIB67_016945 [Kingdonia uniflora]
MGFVNNLFVASALVFVYMATGRIFEGRKVFDEMLERDAVLWTAMLAGYAQHGEPGLGLGVFREMVSEGIELDGVVMVSLFLVLSQLGWLKHGKSVHGWCVRRCLGLGLGLGLGLELNMGNALVDMYVKCGSLGSSHKVFDRMPERDVISWSSLILGYALNGNVGIALDLFDAMGMDEVKPNDVTFLGVLTACAHSGMVDRAQTYFNAMKEYGVLAELKHYACMVDCLGKVGLLTEAERFVEEMPVEPDGAVLGALLGGCRLHGNIEVAERIAKKLIKMEPGKAGYYVLLANIYADLGRFNDAERVRDSMKLRNVSKAPGHSLIESYASVPSMERDEVLFECKSVQRLSDYQS